MLPPTDRGAAEVERFSSSLNTTISNCIKAISAFIQKIPKPFHKGQCVVSEELVQQHNYEMFFGRCTTAVVG